MVAPIGELSASEALYHRGADMAEFRTSALRVVLGSLPGLVLIIVAAFAFNYEGTPIAIATLIPLLLALTYLGYILLSRSTILAAWVTVGGLFLIETMAVEFQPDGSLIVLYTLIVFLAGATLGVRESFLVATAAAVVDLRAIFYSPAVLGPDVALPTLLLLFGSAGLFWVATRPIYTALDWSWESYTISHQMVEQLRDRQGELGRTVKSLNEAYLQLEQLNRELARARLAAEEARRLKSEFAANISHELRTPLNLIIGFSEMMATAPQAYGGAALPPAYQSDLDAILRNARHLSTLIDDVLDLSQIEAGRMGLLKEWIAVSDVVAEAAEAVGRLILGRGLELVVAVAPDLPAVYADRTRIRQVLINLLSNAARFTDNGIITVAARRDSADVLVSVADTGIGIPPEDIPKVFEEFRQLDGSLRRRSGGSGLGLAVSKQFVELHGGSMWAESAVGQGSTFKFTLPAVSTVVVSGASGGVDVWDRAAATGQPEPPEVRVVAADPSVVRIFQRHLDGYRVAGLADLSDLADPPEVTANAAPVPSAPAEPAAWVVVTDSADHAAQQVAMLEPTVQGLPIIACVVPTQRDLAAELGVAGYLNKPISRRVVAEALHRVGGTPRSVLVVDDDTDTLRLLGRMVRSTLRHGQVRLAAGGEEALAMMRDRPPDLVLLDLVMPGIDGYGVLRKIQTTDRLRDVPVVVITGQEQRNELLTWGLVSVTRPGGLSARELMRCVKANLDAVVSGGHTAPVLAAAPAD
jgi:signal transduction histidine kinase/CheY-like chemotaxis protein